MEPQKRILFLYDHVDEVTRYVRALRDVGLDVQHVTKVDTALYLLERECPYALIIWKMWLHPGQVIGRYRVELHGGGTKTGACFVKLVRATHPMVPMLLLTRDRVKASEYRRPEEGLYSWLFSASTPVRFAREVGDLVHALSRRGRGASNGP